MVLKVEFVRFGDFYDLSVPGPEHYLAHGLWHHNSGKTYSNAKRSIALAALNAPAPHGCVSPTYGQARKTVVATIEELLTYLASMGRPIRWRYHKTDHEFTIRGLSARPAYIQVMSGDNPDSLRGPNLGSASLDEPFLMAPEVFRQMIARVRHPRARRREINLTGTPEELNWGYALCTGDPEFGTFDVGYVVAPTDTNPVFGETYAARLRAAFGELEAKAYVGGQFVLLSKGRIYYESADHNYAPLPEEVDLRRVALGAGMDFNVDPMSVTVFAVIAGRLWFIDEVELPNAGTDLALEWLQDRYPTLRDLYPDPTGRARKTAGAAGRSDFDIIRKAGYHIHAPAGATPLRDKWNTCNAALKQRPKLGPRVLIDRGRCPKLARYLASRTHEIKRGQRTIQLGMDHLLDAFAYPVVQLLPLRRPPAPAVRIAGV